MKKQLNKNEEIIKRAFTYMDSNESWKLILAQNRKQQLGLWLDSDCISVLQDFNTVMKSELQWNTD